MRRNAGKLEELTAMQQGNNRQAIKILLLAGLLPVIWLALRIAPALHGGLPVIIQTLNTVFQNPFQFTFNKDSLRAVLVFVAAYALAAGIWLSSQRNFRKGEEYGSAKWGNAHEIVKRYRDPKDSKNLLLTQSIQLALNTRIHGLNLNIIIFGASGTGKSRGYVLPNLMQLNTSFVVLDPKGELLRTTGHLLEENGYEIVVLDLLHMEKSHCYNPFRYIRKDEDVQTIVTLLFDATTPKGSHSQEPFWDEMAGTLLKALMFLLYYEAPEEEQNFQMVLELIRAGEVREENENFRSVLDTLFDRLNMEKPGHIAYRYYENYRKGAGKTLKSIQASLIAHIEKFELDSVAALTMTDEMDLRAFGERKRALFAIIPDNDTSFNFIVSMLYTQLFQQLEDSADFDHRGSLPVPVHVIMDEFEDCGFFESIPLWAITLIGGLFIWVLSFVMILSVYGRFFRLYIYTAIAPVPLATFAGESTQNIGISFLKSYAAICLEGAIIVLACIIFSVFAASPPVVDPDAAAATMVWSYIGQLIFNMLILVGCVRMADRVVREMMGL